MARRLRLGWVVACAVLALGSSLTLADAVPPASDLIPENALITLSIEKPVLLLERALSPATVRLVTSNPAYQQQVSTAGFQQFEQVIRYIEMQVGTGWKDALRSLTSGGVTLAVFADGGSLLIIDGKDKTLLQKLNEVLVAGVRDQASKDGRTSPVEQREVAGVPTWSFDGKEAHALLGTRLVFANRQDVLERALKIQSSGGEGALSKRPSFLAARKSAGAQPVATAFVDMAALRKSPDVTKLLEGSGNPMVAALLGGMTDALGRSSWLSLALTFDGPALAIDAVIDGAPAQAPAPTAFFWPSPATKGALPNLSVPGQIAGMSLFRDLQTFYAAKDQIFPERTSGLIFFENMMGIFFTGRDLTQEVFGALEPEVRFVVARQVYDPSIGTPQVQVPAFALVAKMKDPDAFAGIAEEAWQKAVGLVTVTRGQRAEPGLIIDRATHRDVKFTVAVNSPGKGEDKARLPLRFNYRPSLARVGDVMILSSTEGLTRDLIDAVQSAASERPLAATNTLVSIDGNELATILKADRDYLVQSNMVEKGTTKPEAEQSIDVLIGLARLVGNATLTGQVSEGRPHVRFELRPIGP